MSEENVNVEVAPNPQDAEARKFGWVPKEEWAGPEEKWKPAEDFLARGKEINGFLRRDFDILKTDLSAKERKLLELEETVREFAVHHENTEKRAYERAKKELNEARKKAIELGDGDAFVAVEEELQALEQAAPKPKEKKKEAPDLAANQAALNSWLSENPIFSTDIEVQAIADGLSTLVKQQNPSLTGKEFLDKLAEKVKETIPHKFESGRKTSPVGSSSDAGGGRGSSKKKGYADLPPEAKAACDKFVKQKLLTQDKYVEDFFQGE